MRDFNLEEAKKGALVCTRNGLSVNILDFGEGCEEWDYPIIAEYEDGELKGKYDYYTRDGKFCEKCYNHPLDLMMEE